MPADVIMLGEYYFPNRIGGAEVQAMRRAEGLVKTGLSVTVITFDRSGGKKEEIINGVKVIRYHVITHTAKMLSLSLPVVQALRKNEKEDRDKNKRRQCRGKNSKGRTQDLFEKGIFSHTHKRHCN